MIFRTAEIDFQISAIDLCLRVNGCKQKLCHSGLSASVDQCDKSVYPLLAFIGHIHNDIRYQTLSVVKPEIYYPDFTDRRHFSPPYSYQIVPLFPSDVPYASDRASGPLFSA